MLSAGEGKKGTRLYAWAWLQSPERVEGASERARWVLIRRRLSDPGNRAYYRAAGLDQTTLPERVDAIGSRWNSPSANDKNEDAHSHIPQFD